MVTLSLLLPDCWFKTLVKMVSSTRENFTSVVNNNDYLIKTKLDKVSINSRRERVLEKFYQCFLSAVKCISFTCFSDVIIKIRNLSV